MQTDADVIIAGAGPAGSVASHLLASKGYRVLVLEKTIFPRYKVCGAGLTPKIIREVPFPLDPVIDTTIYSVRFSFNFRDVFTRTADTPVMFCTMRDKLDHFMINRAKAAGADVKFGIRVTGYAEHNDHIVVKTDGRDFKTKLLVSAEGAAGIIPYQSGLNRDIEKGLAWEAELMVPGEEYSRFRETVFLDWGTFPGGYGWVFPKGDHISVGVGGPASLSRQMTGYYSAFIKSFGAGNYPSLSIKSWPIPVKVRKSVFHKGRIMVTGDAAGLTDALTGEGIYYAVKSGRLAAEASIEFLEGQVGTLRTYSERINDEIMEELLRASGIKAVFNTVPHRIHRLVRDHDRVWRAFGKILRGDRKYGDIPNGLGNYRFMWKTFVYISMIIYRFKVSRKRKQKPAVD